VRRKSTPVDAESIYTVVDETGQPKTPSFHHKDLADACLRRMSKETSGLTVRRTETTDTQGGVNEALAVLSREQRWLDMSRSNKGEFPALCEGWLTAPKLPSRDEGGAL